MIAGVVLDGFAAEIHERLRLHEHSPAALRDLGVPPRFKSEGNRGTAGQLIDDPKARIVARARILPARVSEPDDKAKDGLMLHARIRRGLLLSLRRSLGLRFLFLDHFWGGGFLGNERMLCCRRPPKVLTPTGSPSGSRTTSASISSVMETA